MRRAVRNGRVHDDKIAGIAGHLLKPDEADAGLGFGVDQPAQVGGRGGEQAGEPGMFGPEPFAHWAERTGAPWARSKSIANRCDPAT